MMMYETQNLGTTRKSETGVKGNEKNATRQVNETEKKRGTRGTW